LSRVVLVVGLVDGAWLIHMPTPCRPKMMGR
jgi:hypothetical protein